MHPLLNYVSVYPILAKQHLCEVLSNSLFHVAWSDAFPNSLSGHHFNFAWVKIPCKTSEMETIQLRHRFRNRLVLILALSRSVQSLINGNCILLTTSLSDTNSFTSLFLNFNMTSRHFCVRFPYQILSQRGLIIKICHCIYVDCRDAFFEDCYHCILCEILLKARFPGKEL